MKAVNYIITKRRIALCVKDNRIEAVATAKRASMLREVLGHPIDVRELRPAERDQQTWFDPREQVLHLSPVCVFDLAA
ncbi:hypothetical protein [Aquamicrobium defluvii]|uniref:Uncharacterized protein n=1 Tax=Aquamicrobium defluvii TaxID=69279 RepID=A0A011VE07_9HYPH|nr:hypothetical protein [Aquamicrobium defluvii]EXL06690.1 hypothetical protein BG36_06390 [Aquamicrobium defluvii]EZQ14513.1 hypothetical protein CF98_19945 [Halopseudomonas bauzanensis]TDR30326.1 hypothetical protein DES43_14618 [Aquamicrobium defluvii]